MQAPDFLITALNRAFSLYLDSDATARAYCKKMSGKIIAIELRELDARVYLLPGENGMEVFKDFEGEPDAVIAGTGPAFIAAALFHDQGMPGGIHFSGDVELGQNVQKMLKELDFDWEEKLSQLVGDIAAHQISRAVRGFAEWGKQSIEIFGRDLTEYLQEETEDLPRRDEVNAFLHEVDELRIDSDRMQARFNKLFDNLDRH
ncbi:MAG: SCP2 sterol-binding domain-containing protein [Gammaproteobacteria bacterium]|nr:SCP2 sterol-binding domain-containing protein [Gammaproteobacteria bacterium]